MPSCTAPRSPSPGFIKRRCSQSELRVAQLLLMAKVGAYCSLFAALLQMPLTYTAWLGRRREAW